MHRDAIRARSAVFREGGPGREGAPGAPPDAARLAARVSTLQRALVERDAAQRAREERLRRAERLESVGLMAASVAHDLNNLLTGVLANAGLAAAALPPDAGSEPDGGVAALLDNIRLAGARAAELVQHLLARATGAAAGPAAAGARPRAAVDLAALAHETVGLLRPVLDPAARLVLDGLAPGLPRVVGDPTALRQVVMNLLTNASDALGGRPGTVTMECAQVTLREALADRAGDPEGEVPAGRYVVLRVRDTGCGMDDATRRRIFEPFFTTKPDGRGLGLAGARGVVRDHGGRLRLCTAPGAGTTFEVFLPEPAEPAEFGGDHDEAPPALAAPDGGTVLVVDDEPVVRLVAERALTRAGWTVLLAADGDEGVARFEERAEAIDVVFLDLSLPRRDGDDVLAVLRERRPDLPVVVMSGYDEAEVRQRFRRVGIDGFVHKPFVATDLLRALSCVSARRALR